MGLPEYGGVNSTSISSPSPSSTPSNRRMPPSLISMPRPLADQGSVWLVDDGSDRDIYSVAWPATFLLHGQSSGIGDCRSHDASLSVFHGWLNVTEVIVPASPVRSVKSLGSKMGAANHTIPSRIQTAYRDAPKTRARCGDCPQSCTIMPLSKFPRGHPWQI